MPTAPSLTHNPILYLFSFVFTGSILAVYSNPSLKYFISTVFPSESFTHFINSPVVVTSILSTSIIKSPSCIPVFSYGLCPSI